MIRASATIVVSNAIVGVVKAAIKRVWPCEQVDYRNYRESDSPTVTDRMIVDSIMKCYSNSLENRTCGHFDCHDISYQ